MSKIIAIVGTSGVGKTTLIKHLMEKRNTDKLYRLLPVTDRMPRCEEKNYIDKQFVSKEIFDNLVEKGEIKKFKKLYGYRYGYLDNDINRKDNIICEVYYKSFQKFKSKNKNVIGLYIRPNNINNVILGINSRGASEYECKVREDKILDELREMEVMAQQGVFDIIFINSYTEDSKDKFVSLINKLLI